MQTALWLFVGIFSMNLLATAALYICRDVERVDL